MTYRTSGMSAGDTLTPIEVDSEARDVAIGVSSMKVMNRGIGYAVVQWVHRRQKESVP